MANKQGQVKRGPQKYTSERQRRDGKVMRRDKIKYKGKATKQAIPKLEEFTSYTMAVKSYENEEDNKEFFLVCRQYIMLMIQDSNLEFNNAVDSSIDIMAGLLQDMMRYRMQFENTFEGGHIEHGDTKLLEQWRAAAKQYMDVLMKTGIKFEKTEPAFDVVLRKGAKVLSSD